MYQLFFKLIYLFSSSFCVEYDDDDRGLISTTLGRIASYYYLSHLTVQHFKDNLRHDMSTEDVLEVLCDSTEFDQLPVRYGFT